MKKIFVTGISTEVGKTIASAIITEALLADYWKPIQAGELEYPDSEKVRRLISNKSSLIHPSSYNLKTPMSPHAAAKIDGLNIELKHIKEPKTNKHLVIEGAGGLMVPINNKNTMLDLIKPDYKIILVSRHYLGSINHSLLTIKALEQLGFDITILFSGREHPSTEEIILKMSKVKVLGRIDEEPYFDQMVIKEYASLFKTKLKAL